MNDEIWCYTATLITFLSSPIPQTTSCGEIGMRVIDLLRLDPGVPTTLHHLLCNISQPPRFGDMFMRAIALQRATTFRSLLHFAVLVRNKRVRNEGCLQTENIEVERGTGRSLNYKSHELPLPVKLEIDKPSQRILPE